MAYVRLAVYIIVTGLHSCTMLSTTVLFFCNIIITDGSGASWCNTYRCAVPPVKYRHCEREQLETRFVPLKRSWDGRMIYINSTTQLDATHDLYASSKVNGKIKMMDNNQFNVALPPSTVHLPKMFWVALDVKCHSDTNLWMKVGGA